MSHLLNLLNSKCAICSRLRGNPVKVNRALCKLRLLEYGLLKEAEDMNEIKLQSEHKAAKKSQQETETNAGNAVSEDEESEQEEGKQEVVRLKKKQNKLVKEAFENYGGRSVLNDLDGTTLEAVDTCRRATIKQLFADSRAGRVCSSCKGYMKSSRYILIEG